MSSTILSIIQDAQGRLSQSQSASVFGSTDKNTQQFLAIFNEEGRALRRRYPWQITVKEGSFTTVATESQGAFDGTIVAAANNVDYILNDVMWDRTTLLPIVGPKSAQAWQADKALSIGGIYGQYRIRGGNLIINPVPVANDSVFFEYVTKNWLSNDAGDTFYTRVAADTNLALLDEEALTLGVKWRWLKAKGLEYAEDFNIYELNVADLMARDGTKRTVNTNSRGRGMTRGVVIPPGSWPGTY